MLNVWKKHHSNTHKLTTAKTNKLKYNLFIPVISQAIHLISICLGKMKKETHTHISASAQITNANVGVCFYHWESIWCCFFFLLISFRIASAQTPPINGIPSYIWFLVVLFLLMCVCVCGMCEFDVYANACNISREEIVRLSPFVKFDIENCNFA